MTSDRPKSNKVLKGTQTDFRYLKKKHCFRWNGNEYPLPRAFEYNSNSIGKPSRSKPQGYIEGLGQTFWLDEKSFKKAIHLAKLHDVIHSLQVKGLWPEETVPTCNVVREVERGKDRRKRKVPAQEFFPEATVLDFLVNSCVDDVDCLEKTITELEMYLDGKTMDLFFLLERASVGASLSSNENREAKEKARTAAATEGRKGKSVSNLLKNNDGLLKCYGKIDETIEKDGETDLEKINQIVKDVFDNNKKGCRISFAKFSEGYIRYLSHLAFKEIYEKEQNLVKEGCPYEGGEGSPAARYWNATACKKNILAKKFGKKKTTDSSRFTDAYHRWRTEYEVSLKKEENKRVMDGIREAREREEARQKAERDEARQKAERDEARKKAEASDTDEN